MLEAGPVDITISVDTSSVGLRDAADRNVDVLMLTQNTSDWENRMLDETQRTSPEMASSRRPARFSSGSRTPEPTGF